MASTVRVVIRSAAVSTWPWVDTNCRGSAAAAARTVAAAVPVHSSWSWAKSRNMPALTRTQRRPFAAPAVPGRQSRQ